MSIAGITENVRFYISIVELITFKSQFFGAAGRFVLCVFTVAVFGLVIFTFLHWIDRIARLGRLGNTIEKVEEATADALRQRRKAPVLSARNMLDDAFTAIGRDGCQAVEVALRLQKALSSLASLGDADMRKAAVHHAQRAMALAEKALALPEDIASVRAAAGFAMRDCAFDEP